MRAVRTLVRRPASVVARAVVRTRTRDWVPFSRLFAVGERTGWSVDEDARVLETVAGRLGCRVGPTAWARYSRDQAVFLTSHFDALLGTHWIETSNRLGTAYLHGRPGTAGYPEFDAAFGALARHSGRFARIQVTHSEMRDLVLEAGVAPDRVFTIPIGIDIARFPLRVDGERAEARRWLGLRADAFVIGSFQKDGVGWGEGLEPKLVKGPDVLVAVLEHVRASAPELHVLLTGPARGYVCRELERLGIPYLHVLADGREELARAYHALDAYVVASRQEGGPKAVLEAMATGVPLVTTRVGQAQEIVEDGRNGLLAEVGHIEALADALLRIRDDAGLRVALVTEGRSTAERFSHERLDASWAHLLEGFVSRERA